MTTTRFILDCKACKFVRAYDYTPVTARDRLGREYIRAYVREEGTIALEQDVVCPGCKRISPQHIVSGVVNNHECDSRCMSAKRGNCECSCGGENHGKSFVGVTFSGVPK